MDINAILTGMGIALPLIGAGALGYSRLSVRLALIEDRLVRASDDHELTQARYCRSQCPVRQAYDRGELGEPSVVRHMRGDPTQGGQP